MPTLRVTWEAKHQLQDILTSSGFPEDTLSPVAMDTVGPDAKLDIVMALMCMGLYPNVCYHKEKRKVRWPYYHITWNGLRDVDVSNVIRINELEFKNFVKSKLSEFLAVVSKSLKIPLFKIGP